MNGTHSPKKNSPPMQKVVLNKCPLTLGKERIPMRVTLRHRRISHVIFKSDFHLPYATARHPFHSTLISPISIRCF
jgi:hypothetical protein